ncbi:hypothetical protein GS498_20470 [Rhodococcus hoagii]|nr:hypothetical protein [Prescottella equi]
MRVLVGAYRKLDYLPRCIESLREHVSGVSDVVFIDDSGDAETHAWERERGTVVDVGGRGYGAAMSALCEAADGREAFVLEEDFSFRYSVDLNEMSEILRHRPYLAQVALLRGPHFPIEHEHGGLIEALEAKGHKFTDVQGVLEHTATFTCNPSVWRGSVFESGWPQCQWSEDAKRDELLREGYRFGFLPGVRVAHDGIRSGKGY